MRDKIQIAAVITFFVLSVILFVLEFANSGMWMKQAHQPYKIVSGPYKGRVASRLSTPWIGNLYNMYPMVNVPATKEEIPELFPKERGWTEEAWEYYYKRIDEGDGPRTFVRVRWSDLEPIEEDQ